MNTLAPNELVSAISEPAAEYCRAMSLTTSGRLALNSSGQPPGSSPCCWRKVPVAPSETIRLPLRQPLQQGCRAAAVAHRQSNAPIRPVTAHSIRSGRGLQQRPAQGILSTQETCLNGRLYLERLYLERLQTGCSAFAWLRRAFTLLPAFFMLPGSSFRVLIDKALRMKLSRRVSSTISKGDHALLPFRRMALSFC